jgi:hypothetical protein
MQISVDFSDFHVYIRINFGLYPLSCSRHAAFDRNISKRIRKNEENDETASVLRAVSSGKGDEGMF